MSKKFWAVHRVTGERWKPAPNEDQFLVMYDSGYLAVVTSDFYTYVEPLDPTVWQVMDRSVAYTKETTLGGVPGPNWTPLQCNGTTVD